MMEAAESRDRHDAATRVGAPCGRSSEKRLLRETGVRPIVMVVANILSHEPLEMPLVEDDHMVKQISPTVADEAFGDPVLPRAAEAGPLWFDAEALDRADDLFIEIHTAIKDEIVWRRVIREGLAQLLCYPNTARMPGNVAAQNAPPVMGDDEEAIEPAEGQRRHGKEVHRRNGFTVIIQGCCPSLCRFRVSRRFADPAQNGSLRNVEAEHLQFTVDTWCTPRPVLGHHAKD